MRLVAGRWLQWHLRVSQAPRGRPHRRVAYCSTCIPTLHRLEVPREVLVTSSTATVRAVHAEGNGGIGCHDAMRKRERRKRRHYLHEQDLQGDRGPSPLFLLPARVDMLDAATTTTTSTSRRRDATMQLSLSGLGAPARQIRR
jgi:hypothetical protein